MQQISKPMQQTSLRMILISKTMQIILAQTPMTLQTMQQTSQPMQQK
jgi:hypothetical protein